MTDERVFRAYAPTAGADVILEFPQHEFKTYERDIPEAERKCTYCRELDGHAIHNTRPPVKSHRIGGEKIVRVTDDGWLGVSDHDSSQEVFFSADEVGVLIRAITALQPLLEEQK